MNTSWIFGIVFAFLNVCGGSNISTAREARLILAEAASGGGRAVLTVQIVPRIGYGGTIYAVVGVRNRSASPLWLNTRLVANVPEPVRSGEDARNLWFEITYRKDRSVTYRCALPGGPRAFQAGDYRVLKAEESVDSDQDLSCFDLSRLGEYSIVAHYYDRQKSMPLAPTGATPLNYELISAPVVFSVMGGAAK